MPRDVLLWMIWTILASVFEIASNPLYSFCSKPGPEPKIDLLKTSWINDSIITCWVKCYNERENELFTGNFFQMTRNFSNRLASEIIVQVHFEVQDRETSFSFTPNCVQSNEVVQCCSHSPGTPLEAQQKSLQPEKKTQKLKANVLDY